MGHTLSRQEKSAYAEDGFLCNLCQEEGCGPLYHCSDCDYDVHVRCAAIEKQQTHFTHPQHPLHLTHRPASHGGMCDSCGSSIHRWSFRCDVCDYDMHPRCVRAPRCILHPHHPHPLVLSQHLSELPNHHQQCSGCLMQVNKLFYRCGICMFTLHQVCAAIPSKVKHLKHPAHILALLIQPLQEAGVVNTCGECGEQVQGWHLGCTLCNFNLHPVCANLEHDYLHGNVEILAHESNTIWAPRNVQDNAHESTDADRSSSHELSPTSTLVSRSVRSDQEKDLLPTFFLNNVSRDKTHASMQPSTSSVPDFNPTALRFPSSLRILYPCKEDWEAVQRVLWFAKGMAEVSVLSVAQDSTQSRPDDGLCSVCHKGYDCWKPKSRTSCGHHLHMDCALDCLKRSNLCPICGKDLKILL